MTTLERECASRATNDRGSEIDALRRTVEALTADLAERNQRIERLAADLRIADESQVVYGAELSEARERIATLEAENVRLKAVLDNWEQLELAIQDRDVARRACAAFCGDNERLIKAARAETVGDALMQIGQLWADLARISDEMGLPPTIGPAPGELRRILADGKQARAEVERLTGENGRLAQAVESWKALDRLSPDNHHNALACPYCNPEKRALGDAVSGDRL
ncbi:MAG TPA: hypothetical protein VFH61_13715 [Thermoleophilia bacterium]|nr:hypothetical protein [Thermoleophilia bacterium]